MFYSTTLVTRGVYFIDKSFPPLFENHFFTPTVSLSRGQKKVQGFFLTELGEINDFYGGIK